MYLFYGVRINAVLGGSLHVPSNAPILFSPLLAFLFSRRFIRTLFSPSLAAFTMAIATHLHVGHPAFSDAGHGSVSSRSQAPRDACREPRRRFLHERLVH